MKRLDALEALHVAMVADMPAAPPPVHWRTPYYVKWANSFASEAVDGLVLRTADRVAYQQIFDPHYRTVWAEYLDHRSRVGGVPLAGRMAAMPEGLPAHVLFRPVPDLRHPQTLALLLIGETAADRKSVARYAEHNTAAVRERRGSPEAVNDTVARRTLAGLWHAPPELLRDEAMARGLSNEEHATAAMKRCLLGFIADQAREKTRAR